MSPEEKRQRAIDDPSYLENLYERIRQSLSIRAQVAIAASSISILTRDDGYQILLLLDDPWLMTEELESDFEQLANALAAEFDIQHFGIHCDGEIWAAIKDAIGWLVIPEGEFFSIEQSIITFLSNSDRLLCQGWSCDFKDLCSCHLDYQQQHKAGRVDKARMITPDPEECRHFDAATEIDLSEII